MNLAFKNHLIRSIIIKPITMAVAVFFFCEIGHAALGQGDSSVAQDAAALSGSHNVSSAGSYSIHEIRTNNKTVKEFVSANGKVFAVSWRGRVHPDLSVILGAYHAEYLKAAPVRVGFSAAKVNARAPSMRTTSKMKLFKGGHMGDVVGMAYDPDLLPSGVNPEELYSGVRQ